jgi:hypothetical protein
MGKATKRQTTKSVKRQLQKSKGHAHPAIPETQDELYLLRYLYRRKGSHA